jgi:hypothetical protein
VPDVFGDGLATGVLETLGVGVGDGLPGRVRDGDDGEGDGRGVDVASGFASCVVAPAALIGRARGGS